jgi:hypothetical protein
MQTKLKEPCCKATFLETIFLSIHNTEFNELPLLRPLEECMSITIRIDLTFLRLILHVHYHYTLRKYIKPAVYISRGLAVRFASNLISSGVTFNPTSQFRNFATLLQYAK